MSVNLGDRKPSKILVVHQAKILHEELTALSLRSFGIYSRNSPFKNKYNFIVKHDEDRAKRIDAMINEKSIRIESLADDILIAIETANSIFPRSKQDLENRRSYQDEALNKCSMVLTMLNDIVYELDVDINCFRGSTKALDTEVHLIKEWKKSDKNRFRF